jgi:hypothetical protein
MASMIALHSRRLYPVVATSRQAKETSRFILSTVNTATKAFVIVGLKIVPGRQEIARDDTNATDK